MSAIAWRVGVHIWFGWRTTTDLLDTLSQRVMVGDGAMGTQLQAADLTLDDVNQLEAAMRSQRHPCPDVPEKIHRDYFEAGADAVDMKYVRLQSG